MFLMYSGFIYNLTPVIQVVLGLGVLNRDLLFKGYRFKGNVAIIAFKEIVRGKDNPVGVIRIYQLHD